MKSINLTLVSLVLLSAVAGAQIPSYLPDSGLVSWYPFNGNANDESANNNNGALNGPTLTTDRFGSSSSAYDFDGTNDYIFISGNAQFNSLSSLTVSAWYNTSTSTSARTLMTQSDLTAAGERFTMRLNLAQVKNASTCAAGIWNGTTNHPYNTNVWTHYVFTFDQDTVRVYLDGSLVDSADVPNGPLGPCANSPLKIGLHWNGDPQWFLGKLDDIAIWNRPLSIDEIGQLYTAVDGAVVQNDTAVCAGDTLSLQVAGSGLTGFSWSTGDTTQSINVAPTSDTTYFVTIENAFGSSVDSVFIEVSNITIDISTIAPECAGSADGSIMVQASGGLGAISYLWSNGSTSDSLSGLTEYTGFEITASDSLGCVVSDSVYVPQHLDTVAPTLVPMLAGMYYLNEEGIAVVDPESHDNGSTDNCGPISFFVVPSDTLDCDDLDEPRFYDLYAMDADSNISDPGNLSVVTMDTLPPQIFNCPSDDTICQGDSISTAVQFDYSDNCEVAAVAYSGPDEGIIEVAGDTTLSQVWTVEDQSGNTTVCQRDLNVQYAPPVSIEWHSYLGLVPCFVATSDGNPIAYNWYGFGEDSVYCAYDGEIGVEVTYSNGCTRWVIVGPEITGTEQPSHDKISVFPNPFEKLITLNSSSVIRSFKLFNRLGQVVYSRNHVESTRVDIGLSNLSAGTYIIQITTEQGIAHRKVIKL